VSAEGGLWGGHRGRKKFWRACNESKSTHEAMTNELVWIWPKVLSMLSSLCRAPPPMPIGFSPPSSRPTFVSRLLILIVVSLSPSSGYGIKDAVMNVHDLYERENLVSHYFFLLFFHSLPKIE